MRISDWSSDVCSSDLQRPALGIAVLMARYAMELERLAVEEKALFGVDGDGADAERLLDPVEQPPLRVANLGQDAIEIGVGQHAPAVGIGEAQPRLDNRSDKARDGKGWIRPC